MLISLSSCRHGLPDGELSGMHNLQLSWMHLLEGAESKYMDVADRHNTFMISVDDTSSHWRQAAISQDTVLKMRIGRLSDQFERASRRHLYQLKELRSFLEQNEIWLLRIETEGAPRRAIRGSWDARTTQFAAKFQKILDSQIAFNGYGPEYEQLAKRIPGMAENASGNTVPPIAPSIIPIIQP